MVLFHWIKVLEVTHLFLFCEQRYIQVLSLMHKKGHQTSIVYIV